MEEQKKHKPTVVVDGVADAKEDEDGGKDRGATLSAEYSNIEESHRDSPQPAVGSTLRCPKRSRRYPLVIPLRHALAHSNPTMLHPVSQSLPLPCRHHTYFYPPVPIEDHIAGQRHPAHRRNPRNNADNCYTHPEAFLPSKYLPLKPPGRSLAGLGPLGSLE
jgi:hypothetical protein